MAGREWSPAATGRHAQTATSERYAHLADDPIRQANDRIGDHILAVMSGAPKAEVVTESSHSEKSRT